MDEEYEELYQKVEEKHPWFVARRALFGSLAGDDKTAAIIDVGCGTGIFLQHLKELGYQNVAGVETSDGMRRKFRDSTIGVFQKIPERQFAKLFLLDVLEHVQDDHDMLRETFNVLRPGGQLLLSVPAHPFLWSSHDETNRHFRRYRKRELREKLCSVGFIVERVSYWNMFLFPLCFLGRWLNGVGKGAGLEIGTPASFYIYGRLLCLENWLFRIVNLPIGVSLISVASKPG